MCIPSGQDPPLHTSIKSFIFPYSGHGLFSFGRTTARPPTNRNNLSPQVGGKVVNEFFKVAHGIIFYLSARNPCAENLAHAENGCKVKNQRNNTYTYRKKEWTNPFSGSRRDNVVVGDASGVLKYIYEAASAAASVRPTTPTTGFSAKTKMTLSKNFSKPKVDSPDKQCNAGRLSYVSIRTPSVFILLLCEGV